jgi:hypothetical protein
VGEVQIFAELKHMELTSEIKSVAKQPDHVNERKENQILQEGDNVRAVQVSKIEVLSVRGLLRTDFIACSLTRGKWIEGRLFAIASQLSISYCLAVCCK